MRRNSNKCVFSDGIFLNVTAIYCHEREFELKNVIFTWRVKN